MFGDVLFTVFPKESVALTVLVVSLVAASGLAIGSLRFRGFSLGIPGVMFTGLIAAKLLGEDKLNANVMAFIRDFGLIIFVYAVGVQVGPGFMASLRRHGIPLNLMAAAIVLLGGLLSVGCWKFLHVPLHAAVGLFAGATTNAPALGSAGEAFKSMNHSDGMATLTGPAFAISYPFGLMGVILGMVILRILFRINPQKEAEALEAREKADKPELHTLNIELKNPNLVGKTLQRIEELQGEGVVISRVLHQKAVMVAKPDLTLDMGDVLLAVGPKQELSDLCLIVGEETKLDLRAVPSGITTRQVLVTKRAVLGTAVDVSRRLGVTVTRINRAGMEFTAVGDLRLQFGDQARLVGEPQAIAMAAKELGNSPRDLNIARLLPMFIGLALGVVLGSIPVFLPGLPAPVKLGLASGPLIVAIILSRVGRIGPLIWYMPLGASAMLRELGIVLFLIAVGLLSGKGFFDNVLGRTGLHWLLLGAAITLVPLLVVGLAAMKFFKIDYLHACGLLAGSMTSPSLAYVHTMTASEAPAVAFATVYPLTMILRVLLAQLIVLVFLH